MLSQLSKSWSRLLAAPMASAFGFQDSVVVNVIEGSKISTL